MYKKNKINDICCCCDWQVISAESVSFVCVEILQPSQPNGVMSIPVSLPNQTFTGQA